MTFKSGYRADPLVAEENELGEGPLFDERSESVFWVDIERRRVWQFSLAAGRSRFFDVEEKPGCLFLLPDPTFLLVAVPSGFRRLSLEDGVLAPAERLINISPELRFNDGKADAAGRIWIGTMGFKPRETPGCLYRVNTNGEVQGKLQNLTIANGLGWSPDGGTFYYIDSPTKKVMAYAFDPQTGEISEGRCAVDTAAVPGIPDGMSVDAEGMLWVAFWGGRQVARFDPRSGDLLASVEVPCSQVTSCAFGKAGSGDLFITTARTGLSKEALQKEPLAGALFRAKVPVDGLPANVVKGERLI